MVVRCGVDVPAAAPISSPVFSVSVQRKIALAINTCILCDIEAGSMEGWRGAGPVIRI